MIIIFRNAHQGKRESDKCLFLQLRVLQVLVHCIYFPRLGSGFANVKNEEKNNCRSDHLGE